MKREKKISENRVDRFFCSQWPICSTGKRIMKTNNEGYAEEDLEENGKNRGHGVKMPLFLLFNVRKKKKRRKKGEYGALDWLYTNTRVKGGSSGAFPIDFLRCSIVPLCRGPLCVPFCSGREILLRVCTLRSPVTFLGATRTVSFPLWKSYCTIETIRVSGILGCFLPLLLSSVGQRVCVTVDSGCTPSWINWINVTVSLLVLHNHTFAQYCTVGEGASILYSTFVFYFFGHSNVFTLTLH